MSYGIIYKIENKINGKIYIGQTTKTFDERYGGDIRNTHNEHLKRSIEIYGIENFDIDKCVCACETKEELDRVEQFYIYVYNTMDPEHGYNMRSGGSKGKHNEESRQKMSEALSGEKSPMWGKNAEDYMTPEAIKIKREKISKALKGKSFSEEHKQKISKALKGKYSGEKSCWYGKHHSEETKQKMSEAQKGEKHPRARAAIQLSKNGDFIRKWNYIGQAAKELNISSQHISVCCRGGRKSVGGYVWMYEADYLALLQYAF